MGFKASDYTLIFWLNMRGEVWFKVFYLNILKVIWNDVSRKIVLKEKNFPVLLLKFRQGVLHQENLKMLFHT